jgi:hypothetical protein
MPLVQANNYGYTTGIQVQNTSGSTSSTVTITFTPSDAGSSCTQTRTIAPGASETFAVTAWDPGDSDGDNTCTNGQTFVGSAQVTGNTGGTDLVAIVNQHNFSNNKGASYGAFNPDQATAKVVMPLITDHNYGYFTGFNVQNVGTSAATVSCTFYNSARTVGPEVLAPGDALTDTQYGVLGDPYVGSATCTAVEGDAKIIGVVNYLRSSGTADTFLTYEAFNAP